MRRLSRLLAGLFAIVAPVLSESVIVPGASWLDTSGNVIQAHGAGILKVCNFLYNIDEQRH